MPASARPAHSAVVRSPRLALCAVGAARVFQPSGRFETHKKICLSITGFHPESWQPAWGRTLQPTRTRTTRMRTRAYRRLT